MKARETERLLVRLSGYPEGEIDQRTRPLRELNLIPSGPRGSHAPDLEPIHVALMILTMVSRRASDAGQVMVTAMDLNLVPRLGSKFPATALAPLLASGLLAGSKFLKRLEVSADGDIAWATVTLRGRKHQLLFANNKALREHVRDFPDTYDNQQHGGCCHRFVLAAGAVDEFHLHMTSPTKGGWVGE